MKKIQYLCLCGLGMLAACESVKEPITFPPVINTGTVTEIYREGATLSGKVEDTRNATITEFGILCSQYQSMAEPKMLVAEEGDMSSYKVTVRELTPGNTYYYCAYATSGYSTITGEVKSFNTTESNAPVFDNIHCEIAYENGFTLSAHIGDFGDKELLLCGFCYRLDDGSGKEPTIADETVYVDDLTGDYVFPVSGLLPDRTYLVRAFAGNAVGVGYSKTLEVKTVEANVPVLSSIDVVSSTPGSVSMEATLWLPEGEVVTEVGFCWSAESQVPTVDHNCQNVKDEMNGNKLAYTLSGLTPETVYYLRAYAVSTTHGVNYGPVYKFKTSAVTVPEVNPGGGIDDLPFEEL